jgi:hypothetical protein
LLLGSLEFVFCGDGVLVRDFFVLYGDVGFVGINIIKSNEEGIETLGM